MEQTSNTYKYLAIVFAIIAIIFAVLYFTKPSQPVSETFGEITADAEACKVKLETWQKSYGGLATTTVEVRAELEGILEDCKDVFEDSQDKI